MTKLHRIAMRIAASDDKSIFMRHEDLGIKPEHKKEDTDEESVFMRLDDLLGDFEKDPEVKKAVEALRKTVERRAALGR